MTTINLYDHETPCAHYVEVPMWIAQDISCYDLAAILQGGCASGAYMPAVTYHKALQTMSDHGDDVLAYLESLGELPRVDGLSWAGMASHYLSCAVELWASSVEEVIREAIEAEEQA